MYYFIYDKKVFVDDEILDKKAVILDLMKEKANMKKEKFEITYDDLENYNKKLKEVNEYLLDIDTNFNKYKENIDEKKTKVDNDIKKLYELQYINYINKGNAASYNEFAKFIKPEQNPYYNQYL